MKQNTRTRLLTSFLIFSLLAAFTWPDSAKAAPATMLAVSPLTSTATTCADTQIAIRVNDVENMTGYHIEMSFTPGAFDVLEVTNGDFLDEGIYEPTNGYDNVSGSIQFGMVQLNSSSNPLTPKSGSGDLIIIRLRATVPNQTVALTLSSASALVSWPDVNSIPYTITSGSIATASCGATLLTLSPSSLQENQPAGTEVGTLTASGPDAGAIFTFSLVDSATYPDNAAFTVSGDKLLTAEVLNYEAKPSYTLRVRATDAFGQSMDKTFTISVTDGNDIPVALGDTYTTVINVPLSIDQASGVLANDSDEDGDTLTAELVAPTKHGSLSLNADGSFTFQPGVNEYGADSFTYKIFDGTEYSAEAIVTLNITLAVANDFIEHPMVIPSVPWEHIIDNTQATFDISDPDLTLCGLKAGTHSIWYTFTSPITREVSLDTYPYPTPNGYDSMIGVWSGAPGSLAPVACNNDAGGKIQSALTFRAEENITYYVSISAYNGLIQSSGSGSSAQATFNTELHVTSFADNPGGNWFWKYVEGFYAQGITTGCNIAPFRYCPDRPVTRAEMAVFILRSQNGGTYQPLPSSEKTFADVPVAGKEWMEPWIEEFYASGLTTGCNINPFRYCPERQVTRAEMAVFVLRAIHGSDYQPPAATHVFSDVPITGKEWMEPWIDQYSREGLTTGCMQDPLRYCPEQSVTRAEMATFLDRAFGFGPLP